MPRLQRANIFDAYTLVIRCWNARTMTRRNVAGQAKWDSTATCTFDLDVKLCPHGRRGRQIVGSATLWMWQAIAQRKVVPKTYLSRSQLRNHPAALRASPLLTQEG